MDNPTTTPVRTALYRFYTADENLLYVGITKRLGTRWAEHARAQPWWPLVDHQTVQWLSSREAASSAEDGAIATERPVFKLPPAYPGDGWRWPYEQIADGIEAAIRSGELIPGAPVPSEQAIMDATGSSRQAVRHAMALLRERGLLFTRPQRGSFVLPDASPLP